MQFLHKYISNYIPKDFKIDKYPVQISLNYYVPRNYGSISRRKSKDGNYNIIWYPPTSDYQINWDIGNYGYIWLKAFLDTLKLVGSIIDDNASMVFAEGPTTYIEVEKLEDRKLEFIINY